MPFANIGQLGTAREDGRWHSCHFRKAPSQTTVSGNWADLSMTAGNPKPNYYASSPLVAARLDGFDGLFHGDAKAPYTKHLIDLSVVTPTAALVGQLKILDYLLYYPFVDGDAAGEEQVMNNTVTLPRYTDGDGVMVMAVALAPTTGGGSFTFTYVDADGVTRTSPTINCNVTAANIATLITSEQAQVSGGRPWLALSGDARGVRSITSVTVATAIGGLFALVLVKPLADIAPREINTPAEITYVQLRAGAPRVVDGAYLNMISNVQGTMAAGTLTGRLTFAWN